MPTDSVGFRAGVHHSSTLLQHGAFEGVGKREINPAKWAGIGGLLPSTEKYPPRRSGPASSGFLQRTCCRQERRAHRPTAYPVLCRRRRPARHGNAPPRRPLRVESCHPSRRERRCPASTRKCPLFSQPALLLLPRSCQESSSRSPSR